MQEGIFVRINKDGGSVKNTLLLREKAGMHPQLIILKGMKWGKTSSYNL